MRIFFSCYKLLLVAPLFMLTQCKSSNENKFILDENFDENRLGWPEESTSSHQLNIKNGYYNVASIDTSRYRSSMFSLVDYYTRNLPNNYSIKTSFNLVQRSEKESDITNFGLMLNSSSLEYEFSVYWHGTVKVTEYDSNTDSTRTIFTKQLDEIQYPTRLELKISERKFELFVDGKLTGSGRFKTQTRSWMNMRLYTTTSSKVLIDYLRIMKL